MTPTLSPSVLRSSRLADTIERLSSCSGSWYLYEPRERLRSSTEPGSPLVWESVSPNAADSLCWGELDTYSLALCSGLTGSLGLSPLEAVERISERRLWQSVALLWVPSYCESGDYGGSVYQLSNAQALLEEFGGSPGCREVIGGHGSYGLAIDPRYVKEELLEALEALENYPLYDEEHCSQLEENLKIEAFSSWLESDLRRNIESALSSALIRGGADSEAAEERAEKLAENATEEQLWGILWQADSDGCLWSAEHNSMYCDLDRIDVDLITEALL
jgi:hypothetical protein